jgi:DNA-binding CsgD family transcriptional regulator
MHDHFTPGDPAVILMDASLHVSQCSTAAGNMLRHYFGRTPEKRLPSAVTDWITRIRKHTPEGRSLDPFVVGSGSRRLIVRACFDNAVQPVLIVHEEETAFSPARLQQLGLSPRESDVMHWVAQGKTNGEIAQILSLSLGTVNKHVESSLRKLGVENRNQALLLLLDRLGTLVRA